MMQARTAHVQDQLVEMTDALREGDFDRICGTAEHDSLSLTATTMTGPAGGCTGSRRRSPCSTRSANSAREGVPVYFSTDTGASVYVNTLAGHAEEVEERIAGSVSTPTSGRSAVRRTCSTRTRRCFKRDRRHGNRICATRRRPAASAPLWYPVDPKRLIHSIQTVHPRCPSAPIGSTRCAIRTTAPHRERTPTRFSRSSKTTRTRRSHRADRGRDGDREGSVGPTLARLHEGGRVDHKGIYWRISDHVRSLDATGAHAGDRREPRGTSSRRTTTGNTRSTRAPIVVTRIGRATCSGRRIRSNAGRTPTLVDPRRAESPVSRRGVRLCRAHDERSPRELRGR